MRIGKRANPLEIFITPVLFELKVVLFVFIDFHSSHIASILPHFAGG